MSNKNELVQHYIDADLQITVDRDPLKWSTGNGLLHSGLFVCLLKDSLQLTQVDASRFEGCVSMCEVVPGVYDRNLGRKDANAHDDSIGIAAGSVICDSRFHKDVLKHGLNSFFTYDNVDNNFNFGLDWWSFRLRFPHIVLWYFLINGKLRLLSPLLLLYILIDSMQSKRADSFLLNYCMITALSEESGMWSRFKKWWINKFDLPKKLAEYFGEAHPIVALSKESVWYTSS